ncbi:MAG: TlpA disulfide reductase family protein [Chryseolinea sp.]
MNKLLLIILLSLSIHEARAQQIRVIKLPELQEIIHSGSASIQVINFWATWCAPCVKELPLFEKLNAENSESIKITLINLDFADKLDRVKAFVDRKKMKADVLLLDEIDYNQWIDKVDKHWGGAIPATLVINNQNGKRKFIERELEEGELEKLIEEVK